MNKKNLNKFCIFGPVSPNSYSLLHYLIIMQQCVYQMTLRNVDEFKKVIGKVWIVLEPLTLLSTKGETISVFVVT